MAQAFENIGEVWRRAGLFRRVLLVGVVLGVTGGAVLLVNWARQPSMALLYSGVEPDEASEMVEKIREAGVSYELKNGGTAIYVPEDKVYSLRLTLASSGLPTGGNAGYQILDEKTLGASPFSERVKYNRAIEGEVAKSIQTLDAVASARVHIVRPEAALFRQGDRQASATVVVKLKGSYRLSGANVAAVVHMVAGAVEGLLPENVVVVDARGNLLSGEAGNALSAKMATLLDQQRQVEEYLAKKAERLLAAALGPDRSSVEVAVVLDSNSVESEITRYGTGDKPVPFKETIKTSKSTEPASGQSPTAGTTNDNTTDTEYKINQRVERTIVLAGKVKAKTVSVLVDLSPPEKKEGETSEARKALVIADVEEIVKTALGIDDTADKVTVKEATFYRSPQPAAAGETEEGMFTTDFILDIAKRSSLGILVIGVLLALKMFRGSKKKGGAEALAALESQGRQAAGLLPAGAGERAPDLLRGQITKALQDNPDEVKRLFLSWVQSEKGEV